MRNIKLAAVFIGSVLLNSAIAVTIKKVDSKTQFDNQPRFSIPVVLGDNDVARRINIDLQYSLFESLHHNAFKDHRIFGDKDSNEVQHGIVRLDYQQPSLPKTILGFSFGYEAYGAYLTEGSNNKYYSLADGRLIALEELFSPKGQQWLQESLDHLLDDAIHEFLARSVEDLAKEYSMSIDDVEDRRSEQEELYQNCLNVNAEIKGLQYIPFSLVNDGITFYRECGFGRSVRALDDVGTVTKKYTYKELSPYLSTFGKCLLSDKGDQCQREYKTWKEGVWEGKIDNKIPITLIITSLENGKLSYAEDTRY